MVHALSNYETAKICKYRIRVHDIKQSLLVGAHVCYFWLPCRFLNFKPSIIIFQRATLSNQCTSLRKLHLHSGLCGLLMAALHIFLFPHFHSNCVTTNLSVISYNHEWPELIFMTIWYWYVYCLGSQVQNIGQYIEKPFGFAVDISQQEL